MLRRELKLFDYANLLPRWRVLGQVASWRRHGLLPPAVSLVHEPPLRELEHFQVHWITGQLVFDDSQRVAG